MGNWCGAGGVPALGERHLRSSALIWSILPDVLGHHRHRFAARRTLVVGAGMSAATALASLLQLAAASPDTRIVHATRAARSPFKVIDGDVLPQRRMLCELGNSAASGHIPCTPPSVALPLDVPHAPSRAGVTHIGGSCITRLQLCEGVLHADISVADESGALTLRTEQFDEVISCCGYRPDTSICDELQVAAQPAIVYCMPYACSSRTCAPGALVLRQRRPHGPRSHADRGERRLHAAAGTAHNI